MSDQPHVRSLVPRRRGRFACTGSQPDDLQLDLLDNDAGAWGGSPAAAGCRAARGTTTWRRAPKIRRFAFWACCAAVLLTCGAIAVSQLPNPATVETPVERTGTFTPTEEEDRTARLIPPRAVETSADNWQYVERASQFTQTRGEDLMAHLDPSGVVKPVSYLLLSRDDVDRQLRSRLTSAATSADVETVAKAFEQAHHIPGLTDVGTGKPLPRAAPRLTVGLHQAVVDGDADFLHLYMFDSCDEDGDVVEILINNEPFAVVPITHAGATLSVPVTVLPTAIALRGIRDGEGGITVAFRTSQGHFFCRAMSVGEVVPVGLLEP